MTFVNIMFIIGCIIMIIVICIPNISLITHIEERQDIRTATRMVPAIYRSRAIFVCMQWFLFYWTNIPVSIQIWNTNTNTNTNIKYTHLNIKYKISIQMGGNSMTICSRILVMDGFVYTIWEHIMCDVSDFPRYPWLLLYCKW